MERKTAIVTGAGTGIGQGVAITLGQNGYDVVVHYNSSAEGAEEACRRIRDCGGRAWPVQADLSAMSGVRELFAQAMEKLGHLDLYVNNSGITRKSDFLETTEDFFDRMVDVDLKAPTSAFRRRPERWFAGTQKEASSSSRPTTASSSGRICPSTAH